MSNDKQSSVEWVIENLNTIYAAFYFKHIDSETFNRAYKEIIERGEAMHKEEISNAWGNGFDEDDRATSSPFKYYEQTYGGNK
jgi:hypothetical protein